MPWGFIGGLTGAVGLYLAIHEKKPLLTYAVLAESNVLDVRAPLPDLSIQFQGQDIQRSNLNLRLMRVSIENRGEAGIVAASYDVSDTLGFAVSGGRVIEAHQVAASNDYLRSRARPNVFPNNVVALPKLLLDRGSSYAVELLVLHDKSVHPDVVPMGKISGLERIVVQHREPESAGPSLHDDLWNVSLTHHAVRAVFYLLFTLAIGLIIAVAAALVSEFIRRRTLKRRRELARQRLQPALSGIDEVASLAVLWAFEMSGDDGIRTLDAILRAIAIDPAGFATWLGSVRDGLYENGMMLNESRRLILDAAWLAHGLIDRRVVLADPKSPVHPQLRAATDAAMKLLNVSAAPEATIRRLVADLRESQSYAQ